MDLGSDFVLEKKKNEIYEIDSSIKGLLNAS